MSLTELPTTGGSGTISSASSESRTSMIPLPAPNRFQRDVFIVKILSVSIPKLCEEQMVEKKQPVSPRIHLFSQPGSVLVCCAQGSSHCPCNFSPFCCQSSLVLQRELI